MQDGDEDPTKAPDNEESPKPSSSYVYPVKSLLTGIQPAPPTQSRPSIPCRNSGQAGDFVALQGLLTHQLARTHKKSTAGPDMTSPHPTSPRSHSIFCPYPSRTAIAGPSDLSEDHPRDTSDPFSPRMQPIDRQSSLPISFTDAALPPTSTQASISGSANPLAPPNSHLSLPSDPSSDTSPGPPQSPGVETLTSLDSKPPQNFTEYIMNEKGRASPTHSINSHISQSGIVHLPPLSIASGSSRAGSRGSSSHSRSPSRKYIHSLTNSNTSSQRMQQVPEAREEGKADDSSSRSSPDPESDQLNTEGKSEAAGDFVTTRYRHETNENGNHIVIGREGDIRRCEDEVRVSQPHPCTPCPRPFFFSQPIRTPGAIQGFGVMIVVAEDAYAGTLTVRQVSEVSSPSTPVRIFPSSTLYRIQRTS